MNVPRLKLVALAVGLAAAGPAFGYTLTVSARAGTTGAGAGTLVDVEVVGTTLPVAPLSCASGAGNCTATYPDGGTLTVLLQANPAAGSAFAGWSGCPNARTSYFGVTGNLCVLPPGSTPRFVTAYFKPGTFAVTVKPGPTAPVLVAGQASGPASCAANATCNYTFDPNALATVSVAPANGTVTSFTGATCINPIAANVCEFKVTSPRIISPVYSAATRTYYVGLTLADGVGGTTISGGAGISAIACPGDCNAQVPAGTNYTLTATGTPVGSTIRWTGCTSYTATTCTISSINGSRAITASIGSPASACNACHAVPPSSHGPNLAATDCAACHGAGSSMTQAPPSGHGDGDPTGIPTMVTPLPPNEAYAFEIMSITTTADAGGGVNVVSVTFKAKDKAGNAVQLGGTGRPSFPSIVLSKLNADGTYKAYYARKAVGATYKVDGVNTASTLVDSSQDTGAPAGTGATGNTANFSAQAADGSYTYTFPQHADSTTLGTTLYYKANSLVAPADIEKLHTIAIYGSRTVTGFAFPAATSFEFAPAGNPVTARAVVSDAACNACHGQLQLHGSRRGVKSCLGCHNPTTVDPESGNHVDLATMVHKIHNGHLLANRYHIVGHQQTNYEYNHVLMAPSHSGYFEGSTPTYANAHDPGLSRECGICHDSTTAAQAGNAFSNPSIRACGSCHDATDFVAHHGEGDVTAVACTDCHDAANNELVHSRFYEPNYNLNFMNAAQVDPPIPANGHTFTVNLVNVTASPTGIVFTIEPKLDGAEFTINAPPAGWRLSTCAFMVAGPTTDYTLPATGGTTVTCTSSGTGTWASVGGGRYTYTNANPLTAAAYADGYYTAAFEIMVSRVYGNSTDYIRKPFSANPNFLLLKKSGGTLGNAQVVSDPIERAFRSRRAVVSFDKCNACHVDLGFHSNRGRKGPDYCATCHNPKLDNTTRARPKASETQLAAAYTGVPGFDPTVTGSVYLVESVSMNVFIHRIHMGKSLPSVSGKELTEYGSATLNATPSVLVPTPGEIVYGATRAATIGVTATTAAEHADFTEFLMPNPMNRCDQCHINVGAQKTWALPERAGLAPIERSLRACNAVSVSWSAEGYCDVTAGSGSSKYMPATTPAVKIVTPPQKAVCTGCHDSAATYQHADTFTINPMTAGAIENCAACHGAGKSYDSLRVHRPVP